MTKNSGKRGKEYVEYVGLSMVGMQTVVSVLIGFAIGYWIDKWLGTAPLFMILFVIFGVAAGFINVYRTMKKGQE